MMKNVLLLVTVLAVFGCACGRGYSDGDRTGLVTKLSHKGMVLKSWEGELVMGGVRSSPDSDGNTSVGANVWTFSVHDDNLVKPLQDAQQNGTPVVIHYTQWLNSGPGYDSDYEVTGVSPVKR